MRAKVAAVLVLLLTAFADAVSVPAPADAGDADHGGELTAAIYNVTPYTMALVGFHSDHDWSLHPTTAVAGGGTVYSMNGSQVLDGGACIGSWKNSYSGWISWEVDVLGGPTEYITLSVFGDRTHSTELGCVGFVPPNDTYPALDVYNTTTPPDGSWTAEDGAKGIAPGPLTVDPQLTNTHNIPYLLDQTVSITGDWTADANTPLGRGLDDALNNICGQKPENCDFTQTGELVWGAGAPVMTDPDVNCDAPGTKVDDYSSLEYEATQEATLTVGGGVSASTELKLFGIIGSKITVSVEAEHEWSETKSIAREAKTYIGPQQTGTIWVAPNIGTVRGTMRLRTGTSTFTLLNFRQVRSGVTKDNHTPAYNAMTEVRPATAMELHKFCGAPLPARPLARSLGQRAERRAELALAPGRGVGRLRLGSARSVAALGRPLIKSPRANRDARANDCLVLDPHCTMAAGRGGTWVYDDTAVVFDVRHRVSALIHSGSARTDEGVGVGSRLQAVRRAYPEIACLRSTGTANCTLRTGSPAVHTTFHFATERGRLVTDKIMIYRVDRTVAGGRA